MTLIVSWYLQATLLNDQSLEDRQKFRGHFLQVLFCHQKSEFDLWILLQHISSNKFYPSQLGKHQYWFDHLQIKLKHKEKFFERLIIRLRNVPMLYFSPKSFRSLSRHWINFSRILCSASNFTNERRSSKVHERPMGHKFIKPVRNSINVPRFSGNTISDMYLRA